MLAFSGIIAGVLVRRLGLPPLVAFTGWFLTGLESWGCSMVIIITRLRIQCTYYNFSHEGILRGVTQIISPSGVANLPRRVQTIWANHVFLGFQSPFWVMMIVVVAIAGFY